MSETKASSLSLRRPSAGHAPSTPSTPSASSVAEEAPTKTTPSVSSTPSTHAPRRERVRLSREAERLTKEAEADFFVTIPESKKRALKTYCVQQGISMRDWLLAMMEEKKIGVEGAEPKPVSRRLRTSIR